MAASYEPLLVVLSIVVACLAAYSALAVVDRVLASKQRAIQRAWLGAGAAAMGSGIWAMHFIAMLAFSLPVTVDYEVWITVVSMIPAVLGSGVALIVMSQHTVGWRRLHLGGLLMAVGIGTMHYTGMEAVRGPVMMRYHPVLFVASILVAYALATFALYIKFLSLFGI